MTGEPIGAAGVECLQCQWQKVYNLLANIDVNHVVTYAELDQATDTDFRAAGRPGLDKAVKTLERNDSRTVECVRNQGYRIVRADEHERLAHHHQKKARRQVTRAKRKVTSADRHALTSDQCRRLDDLETNLAQQATILRKTNRRVDDLAAARQQDNRRVNEELAMLNQAVQSLHERIEGRAIPHQVTTDV